MKLEFQESRPRGPHEGVDLSLWRDWRWQLQHSLKKRDDFAQHFQLTPAEERGFELSRGIFQIRTTPYYASLADPLVELDPLRLMQVPRAEEAHARFQEMLDPLGEIKNSVHPRLIHRYADRVLFLVTDFCSVYCRYCTRKRFTGHNAAVVKEEDYATAIQYLRAQTGIREVILSGGDPLTLSDDRLEVILRDLRGIEHIEIIRVGSRMPVVNPFRITDALVALLRKYKPVFFMAHFNHPRELTREAAQALELLVDGGVPVLNQMVLLNGVNNHAAIVRALSRRLLYLRVKPYYMFQCDPSMGTDHLRTSIDDSLAIQRELWGHLSGLAMPQYSIDIPDGGGKTSMTPNFLIEREGQRWSFRGFDGVVADYIDPSIDTIIKPCDLDEYLGN